MLCMQIVAHIQPLISTTLFYSFIHSFRLFRLLVNRRPPHREGRKGITVQAMADNVVRQMAYSTNVHPMFYNRLTPTFSVPAHPILSVPFGGFPSLYSPISGCSLPFPLKEVGRKCQRVKVASSSTGINRTRRPGGVEKVTEAEEEVYFDGGAHYGDLLTNIIFGFSLLWLPLTVAAIFRALFLRYRFTNLRVTVISGLTGTDRRDFSYKAVKDVQSVPRFFGEWGDIIITLTDDTKVDLRSVPRFRQIANYCTYMAAKSEATEPKGKGF